MKHLSQTLLARVFRGRAGGAEIDRVVAHLAGCRSCWSLAANVMADLDTRGRLKAAFSSLLEEASRRAVADPASAENVATLALLLVDHLGERGAEELRNDLRGEAWTVIANCRRLGTDWKGAEAALGAALNFLAAGTRDVLAEARLLSVQASLATDTGRVEPIRGLLGRAGELYAANRDWTGAARIAVQEATALQELFPEEALGKALQALRRVGGSDARLTMYARSIVTESLIVLGRIPEALRSFEDTRPLYEQFPEPRVQLRVRFIEARLADAGERIREAERLYSEVALACSEAELYKDSFVARLALLDFYVRRERMDAAAEVCREAVATMVRLGIAHDQMRAVWRDLLASVEQRRIEPGALQALRVYLVRYWSSPAALGPFGASGARVGE